MIPTKISIQSIRRNIRVESKGIFNKKQIFFFFFALRSKGHTEHVCSSFDNMVTGDIAILQSVVYPAVYKSISSSSSNTTYSSNCVSVRVCVCEPACMCVCTYLRVSCVLEEAGSTPSCSLQLRETFLFNEV